MSLQELYNKRKEQSEKDIQKILSKINISDMKEVWNSLREYSCYFEDAPESMRTKIMEDTGYYDHCYEFYSNNGLQKKLEDYLGDEHF